MILIVLFAAQSRGTAKVAALFGPIMMVWFVVIAIPGVLWVAADPGVLWALNPLYGIDFLVHHGMIGLYTLGAVFLASPAPRRSTRISGISAAGQSRSPGFVSCCRRWR